MLSVSSARRCFSHVSEGPVADHHFWANRARDSQACYDARCSFLVMTPSHGLDEGCPRGHARMDSGRARAKVWIHAMNLDVNRHRRRDKFRPHNRLQLSAFESTPHGRDMICLGASQHRQSTRDHAALLVCCAACGRGPCNRKIACLDRVYGTR